MAEGKKAEGKKKLVSRRDFLVGSGAVIAAGALSACTPKTITNTVTETLTKTSTTTSVAPPITKEAVTTTLPPTTQTVTSPPTTVTTTKTVTATLQKATGYISYNGAKCSGCQTCMAVCSLSHDGEVNRNTARIQINAPVMKIFNAEGITCKQCDFPECYYACLTGALTIDTKTGARVIDAVKCVGCQLCLQACPQYPNSPIRYNATTKKCVKCDLCGGDPQCIKLCPNSVSLTPNYIPVKDHVLKFIKTGTV